MEDAGQIGVEFDDGELLDIETQFLDVVVTSKKIDGMTLGELAISDLGQEGCGVFVRKVMRAGREMPFTVGFRLYRGDALTLVDAKGDVERVATRIGYADRPTEKSDLFIVGFGIFVGGLIGAGPAFTSGLQTQGLELFTVGVVGTTLPLIVGLHAGKYIFRMEAPIILGTCAGARTTTAAPGAIEAGANSRVSSLGHTVAYDVGNTLLTIWGVVIVIIMT